jgi:hypothetical protein
MVVGILMDSNISLIEFTAFYIMFLLIDYQWHIYIFSVDIEKLLAFKHDELQQIHSPHIV